MVQLQGPTQMKPQKSALRNRGKRESPTPNSCFEGQHRVLCHWDVWMHLCRLCDFGNILFGSPLPHLTGLWEKAER